MARWEDVLFELGRYPIERQGEGGLILRWEHHLGGHVPIVVRRVEIFGVSWLRVSASIGHVRGLPLGAVLRGAGELVGAVVIEHGRCVLRETACLEHISASAVHALVAVIGRQTGELTRAVQRRGERCHAYAMAFAI